MLLALIKRGNTFTLRLMCIQLRQSIGTVITPEFLTLFHALNFRGNRASVLIKPHHLPTLFTIRAIIFGFFQGGKNFIIIPLRASMLLIILVLFTANPAIRRGLFPRLGGSCILTFVRFHLRQLGCAFVTLCIFTGLQRLLIVVRRALMSRNVRLQRSNSRRKRIICTGSPIQHQENSNSCNNQRQDGGEEQFYFQMHALFGAGRGLYGAHCAVGADGRRILRSNHARLIQISQTDAQIRHQGVNCRTIQDINTLNRRFRLFLYRRRSSFCHNSGAIPIKIRGIHLHIGNFRHFQRHKSIPHTLVAQGQQVHTVVHGGTQQHVHLLKGIRRFEHEGQRAMRASQGSHHIRCLPRTVYTAADFLALQISQHFGGFLTLRHADYAHVCLNFSSSHISHSVKSYQWRLFHQFRFARHLAHPTLAPRIRAL